MDVLTGATWGRIEGGLAPLHELPRNWNSERTRNISEKAGSATLFMDVL